MSMWTWSQLARALGVSDDEARDLCVDLELRSSPRSDGVDLTEAQVDRLRRFVRGRG